jgi:uncharacterized membrane protein
MEQIPSRLIALSDGLFATVLTLLVLDLRPTGVQGVHAFLKELGPHLFSYLLTFLVAGTYWLTHHRDFDFVVRHDRTLLGYNLLFLLFIGLLPFSTAAIGQWSLNSDEYPFYWALYAANIILAGCMLTLAWVYAVRSGLVNKKARARSRNIIARQLLIPAIFLVSIAAEYAFPSAFLGPYMLLSIPIGLWVVDRVFRAGGGRERSRKPDWTSMLWRAGTILPWLVIIALAWTFTS